MSKWLNNCGKYQIPLIPTFPQLKTLSVCIKVWQIFPEQQIVNPTRIAFLYLNKNSVVSADVIMKGHSFELVQYEAHAWGYQFTQATGSPASMWLRLQGQCTPPPLSTFWSQDTKPGGFYPQPSPAIPTPILNRFLHVRPIYASCTSWHLGLFGWVSWLTSITWKQKTVSLFAAWNISSKKCGEYGNQIWLAASSLLPYFCSSIALF